MRKRSVAGVAVLVLLCAGCGGVQKPSPVQKGSLFGSAAGAGVGTIAGHLTNLGGFEGGLIGLPIGAAVGALTADVYYSDSDQDIQAAAVNTEELERLTGKLSASEAKVAELQSALDEERAQRDVAVEALGKGRGDQSLSDKFGPGVQVTPEPDGGIKLTILSEVLFASGKASLTNDGQGVLAKAAKTIRDDYPEFYVEVRGHTDNVPIRYSKFASNWELSCERALAVLHYLIEKEKFDPKRMMVAGFGETTPVTGNDSADGRRKNRRAEIVLHPKSVQQIAAQ